MAYHTEPLAQIVRARLALHPCLSLSEIARELGVSRHALSRALRNIHGASFRQLRCAAMSQAAESLLSDQPHKSVKEIAFSLGYRSPQAFSRFVKNKNGLSPKGIRRQKRA